MAILDKNNKDLVNKYENFVKTSEYGHMMQSMNWGHVKNNWESDYIYLEDDQGNIKAALSILSVKNDNEHAFMYAPRGPVCDFSDTETVEKLIEEAQAVADKHNAFLLRIDPEIHYDEELVSSYRERGYTFRSRDAKSEKSFSNPRHNMILDIENKDEDEVMSGFSSRQRNKIRKTYKRDLWTRKIDVSDEEYPAALDRFFDLTKEMSDRQDITYRPKDYFDRLMHAFDDAKIFETIDDEDQVLSTSIVVTYNNKSFYIYAASSNIKRNFNASTQMNFEAIKYAISKGSTEYDFGGVYAFDTSDGLYAFKYSFCGDEGLTEFIGELDVVYNKELYSDFLS